ncbi:N-acetylmuramic acid-6-phosphate etherase [Caloranaerobacter azorensis H53214]|uniref:N-acetylmuramic acid 6-phosphate etherase n=1 Tax=Caloranaerobacter azorensis H53214 TaxID=1156417 RepID=A0A096DKB8_9FIRM|nr:N-acetylmuramic acid 6-phosphate etherase [Caloranaerobacter azorensis]KGG79726.1 N-acetylmuramic acid-6-phosphate etherase [Caloranaerobacter azorensis H53214]
MACNLENLVTEAPNIKTSNIDQKTPLEILQLMNNEDKKVALAVEKELPNIARGVEKIIESFNRGGRLIYIGAGTSGRLGILDAAECPPTFGTPQEQVIGIIAGGQEALTKAIEGAEDSFEKGMEALKEVNVSFKDVVVGITASGRTPYVIGALRYAKDIGATTVAVSCNSNAEVNSIADISITPVVGPEIIAGSTRLKAGTAQKMVLNMLSTSSMIGIGKVYKNLMVDVQPTNKKLIERAKRIIMMATGVSYEKAEKALIESNYKPKIAIIMIKTGCSYQEALVRIKKGGGFVHKAIKNC